MIIYGILSYWNTHWNTSLTWSCDLKQWSFYYHVTSCSDHIISFYTKYTHLCCSWGLGAFIVFYLLFPWRLFWMCESQPGDVNAKDTQCILGFEHCVWSMQCVFCGANRFVTWLMAHVRTNQSIINITCFTIEWSVFPGVSYEQICKKQGYGHCIVQYSLSYKRCV